MSKNGARDLADGTPFTEEHPDSIARRLPEGAVHQGFAARAKALEPASLKSVADPTHGVPYYFDLERKCSQWEFPSAPSAAPTPPAAMPTSVATSEYSLDMSAAAPATKGPQPKKGKKK